MNSLIHFEGAAPKRPNRPPSSGTADRNLERKLAKLERSAPGSPERNGLLVEIARLYADTDPEAGFDWLQSLDPASGDLGLIAASFASRLVELDPEKWRLMVGRLEPGLTKDRFIFGGVTSLGRQNVSSGWVEWQQFRGQVRNSDQLEKGVSMGLARSDGSGFWEIVKTRCELDVIGGEKDFVQFFSMAEFDDSSAAVRALSEVVDPVEAQECLHAYINSRPSEEKLPFAEAFITSNRDVETNDRVLVSILESTFYHLPGESARLIHAISDDKKREEITRKLLEYAERSDPAMAVRVQAILQGE
ncbi:hypothetical protein ACFQY0_15305 [Haloferula chungangensis]|uniref:HEAT repeat domain-containing protein n=1 Tax=Haloferula chungangensis TaxID=1048331 RepID=A0ABW2LAR0_9BACT